MQLAPPDGEGTTRRRNRAQKRLYFSRRSRIFQDAAVSRLELQRIIDVCEAIGAESAVSLAPFVSRPLSFARGTTLTRTRYFLMFHFQGPENDPFVLVTSNPDSNTIWGVTHLAQSTHKATDSDDD